MVTSNVSREKTSFIYRDAIWKPWVSAAWPAENNTIRSKSLS